MNSKIKIIFSLLAGAGLLFVLPFIGGEKLELFNNPVDHRILFELRLPRLIFVLLAGGALAVIGATYQILFNNPLADPYILGISSAVTLGTVIAEVVLKLPPRSFTSLAIGFSSALLVTLLLIFGNSRRMTGTLERVVLFGMGLNFVLSSALFLILSYHSQSMGGGSIRWLFGSIPWVSKWELGIFALVSIPFCLFLFIFGRHLDALSFGDSVARTLGFSPQRSRNTLLFVSCLYLSILASMTGSIGFIGLVVPHSIRLLYRPSTTRVLFALSFFFGAIYLGFSDSLSRAVLPPFEFPIGIITTLLGGPIFLYLLWKR